MQQQNEIGTARSAAAVREIEIQMAEAAGPHAPEESWAVILHFATLLMTPPQYRKFCDFAVRVLEVRRERAD